MFLVFEIFDLDGSNLHVDVVDLDGTDCPELKLGGPLHNKLTWLDLLQVLPQSRFFSNAGSCHSDLFSPNGSFKLVCQANLYLPMHQVDHARLSKFHRREIPSKSPSTEEPA